MWVCKQFNVLPSNPDFQNLTEEQRALIWEDYLLDNPKIKERIENDTSGEDEEFNELWEKDSLEFTDMTADINLEEFEEKFKQIDDKERSTIDYPAHARRVFDMIENHKKEQERIQRFNTADWEEDEDTVSTNLSDYIDDSDDFYEV